MSTGGHYESNAERWAAWVRAPGHDAYWTESGPALFELLPPPGRRTLDLGCGEGRVARDLTAKHHRVVGIDVAPTLVRLAQEADPTGTYLVADAAALPFQDEEFDVVVAFNSLMDVDDLPAAVHESARVLEPGGKLCLCITHPLRDAGSFAGEGSDDPLVVSRSYFAQRRLELTIARGGFELDFQYWARPLEAYTTALTNAGFALEALREPPDPHRSFPNFLLIRAVK